MRLAVIARVMGMLLILFSSVMLPCVALAWFEPGDTFRVFLTTSAMTLVTGGLLYLPLLRVRKELRLREGFVIVTLFWALLAVFGALPLVLTGVASTFTDAYFEAISALTTTGSTVLTGLDAIPGSINLWRGTMQFLGGGGIVVLAVAVLPLLGVGGMQLYKAETPGPMKDNKLTPRIRETAKSLWYVYLGLVVACGLTLFAAGMTPLDAVIHAFTAVATGGFSSHDASVGYFESPTIEMILTLFMFLGGVNFGLHFIVWRHRSLRSYWHDVELRAYSGIMAGATLFIAAYLVLSGTYPDALQALRYSVFQVVSIATTCGYASADYALWPPVLGALLMILCFFTGSAGSTVGGMKLVRVLLLLKQGGCEIRRLVHPNSIVTLKYGGRSVPERTIAAVTTFFTAYLGVYAGLALVVAALGVDLVTAFSAVAATLTNTGPGLGSVGPAANFAGLPEAVKWVLSFAMLLGRLELFTLLVLFTPAFWRT